MLSDHVHVHAPSTCLCMPVLCRVTSPIQQIACSSCASFLTALAAGKVPGVHGVGGHVKVENPRYHNVIHDSYFEAAKQIGLPHNPDFNNWNHSQVWSPHRICAAMHFMLSLRLFTLAICSLASVQWLQGLMRLLVSRRAMESSRCTTTMGRGLTCTGSTSSQLSGEKT